MVLEILSHLRRRRFTALLVTLTLMSLSTPVAHAFGMAAETSRKITAILFGLMLLAAIHAAAGRDGKRYIMFALMVPLVALHMLAPFLDSERLDIADDAFSMIFLGYVVVASLRLFFSAKEVTFETISASLCVYLLVGVFFATAFSLVDRLYPEAFFSAVTDADLSESPDQSLYYSFVTLTTLGYGDIVPVQPLARTLAFMEAIIGQIYLTVLVARLVGLHIARSRRG